MSTWNGKHVVGVRQPFFPPVLLIDDVSSLCLVIYFQVEYMLMELDDKDEKVRLVLNGGDVLETLQDQGEKINPK